MITNLVTDGRYFCRWRSRRRCVHPRSDYRRHDQNLRER